jgi:hypothetical protein
MEENIIIYVKMNEVKNMRICRLVAYVHLSLGVIYSYCNFLDISSPVLAEIMTVYEDYVNTRLEETGGEICYTEFPQSFQANSGNTHCTL